MAFVKLDCNILNSTIWFDFNAKNVFLTALLMARPRVVATPQPQIEVDSLELTGYVVPPGEYGFVEAAGIGIVHLSGVGHTEGLSALRRLCSPEADSRSTDFDGRRMARVDGGYLVLNHDKYHRKDHTSPARSARWREKKAAKAGDVERERTACQGVSTRISEVRGKKAEVRGKNPKERAHTPSPTHAEPA